MSGVDETELDFDGEFMIAVEFGCCFMPDDAKTPFMSLVELVGDVIVDEDDDDDDDEEEEVGDMVES